MTAPKKIDSGIYNELVYGAYEDAKETFLEEQLGYWYSGPGTQGEEFPPAPRRVDADAWARNAHGAMGTALRATDDEWEVYSRTYSAAVEFASKYVEKHWDPDSEDQDHYNEVCEDVATQLEEGDLSLRKAVDPTRALVRACRLVLAIEANPEQNPTETVRLSPKTREQILAAVRAAE